MIVANRSDPGGAALAAASAASGPWDVGNNCGGFASLSRREPSPRAKKPGWDALQFLHETSTLDAVRACRRFVIANGDAVGVVHRGDRAHFSGLQTCGSVWSCPLCSEKVLAERADELRQAVETWRHRGGQIALVTLTMRHHRGQALDTLWSALSDAWRAATSGNRAIRRAFASAGVEHWVRRVEATEGANGWHLHVHVLLFLPATATAATVCHLAGAMFDAWKRRLFARGLRAPIRDKGGLDFKLLDFGERAADVAGYLAKGAFTESALSAARELAGGAGKRARGDNRSPMELLADLVAYGEARDFALWREWEAASKGRRAITWSGGARLVLLADPHEPTDEELAQESDGAGQLVAVIPREGWRVILDRRLAAPILEAAESVDADRAYDAIEQLLAAHGLPPPLRPS